jgi:putative salt-induced outer membrane protein
MKITWQCCTLSVFFGLLLSSRPCRADEPLPSSLVTSSQASSGSTDVATSGFEKADKPPAETKDASELQLSAGGLASAGNSRSLAATSAGKFRLRRGSNQIGAALAANYAQSAAAKGEGLQTTVENLQGKLRYDRFLAGSLAMFGALSVRHDRFQGLDLRLNLDPGVEYYLIDQGKQQLWSELGYDLQYDVRTAAARAAALAKRVYLAKAITRHSARLFAGYSNALSDAVTVATSLEYLQGLAEAKNYRLNWDGSVNSDAGKGFSIATSVSVRYDHNPLPEIEKTDVLTSVSLVYHLL